MVVFSLKDMNKINIDNNSIMQLAIQQVDAGDFYKAITNFAKVDSYESLLNQFACYCCLTENLLAMKFYCRLNVLYFDTHNVASDIASLGDRVEHFLGIMKEHFLYNVVYSDSKISANKKLIANYGKYDVDIFKLFDDVDVSDAFGEQQSEEEYAIPKCCGKFFNVKSPSVAREIAMAWADAENNGDEQLADSYALLLLKMDSDDYDVLASQIHLACKMEKFQQGLVFVKKLLQNTQINQADLKICSYIILEKLDLVEEQTMVLFLSLLVQKQVLLESYDYYTCVHYANNTLCNYQLAEQLVTNLVTLGENRMDDYRLASLVCYNTRNWQMLKSCLIAMTKISAEDVFSHAFLRFLHNTNADKIVDYITIPDVYMVCLYLPEQIVEPCYDHFATWEKDFFLDTEDDYLCFKALCEQCKYYGLDCKFSQYAKYLSCLRVILDYFQAKDSAKFNKVLLLQLAEMYSEPGLIGVYDGAISRLIADGYKGKILLHTHEDKSAIVDLSRVTIGDKAFCDALALCCVLHKVNVEKMQNIYLQLKQMQLPITCEFSEIRKLAYCLLCACYKKLSPQILELFQQSDEYLYNMYLLEN